MSDLQTIEILSRICADQAKIISAQAAALAQVGAVCAEEERAEVGRQLAALLEIGE